MLINHSASDFSKALNIHQQLNISRNHSGGSEVSRCSVGDHQTVTTVFGRCCPGDVLHSANRLSEDWTQSQSDSHSWKEPSRPAARPPPRVECRNPEPDSGDSGESVKPVSPPEGWCWLCLHFFFCNWPNHLLLLRDRPLLFINPPLLLLNHFMKPVVCQRARKTRREQKHTCWRHETSERLYSTWASIYVHVAVTIKFLIICAPMFSFKVLKVSYRRYWPCSHLVSDPY